MAPNKQQLLYTLRPTMGPETIDKILAVKNLIFLLSELETGK